MLLGAHAPPPPLPPCSIRFWGRLSGTTSEYLLVCGTLSTSSFPERKYYYATTRDLTLQQLPPVTPEFAAASEALTLARFVGNPAKLLGADADADPDAEEEVDDAGVAIPKRVLFTEAHRLAATVAAIERECGAVPRGAYAVTATRHVVPNAAFGGVSASEATSLNAWAHFRAPQHPARAAALSKASAVPATSDFLDSLADDAPCGLWATQLDAARAIARVASIKWPGYFAFASLDEPRWGAVYVGDGRPAEVQFAT